MEKQVKVITEGVYVSHGVKKNKSIDLVIKAPYSELRNYIQTIQMLNENVDVSVKIGSDKPVLLGSFMISNINVDNDGEGKVRLNSQLDFVNANEINTLASRSDEPLKVLFKCKIDSEDESEESDDE